VKLVLILAERWGVPPWAIEEEASFEWIERAARFESWRAKETQRVLKRRHG